MKNAKLSPKDRKEIARRVKSGVGQTELAREYGVSQGYISKVVSKEKSRVETPAPRSVDKLRSLTIAQLENRYGECLRELNSLNLDRLREENTAQQRSKNLADEKDTEYKQALQASINRLQNTRQYSMDMQRLLQEMADIHAIFITRGATFNVLFRVDAY